MYLACQLSQRIPWKRLIFEKCSDEMAPYEWTNHYLITQVENSSQCYAIKQCT